MTPEFEQTAIGLHIGVHVVARLIYEGFHINEEIADQMMLASARAIEEICEMPAEDFMLYLEPQIQTVITSLRGFADEQ